MLAPAIPLQNLAPNLWLMTYPLRTLGVDLQRNVTILRLPYGKLIIHSTAPFTPEDVAEIKALGEPAWLIDTLLRHDTYAEEGRQAFPEATYLAPAGFSINLPFQTHALLTPPKEWEEEVAILAIDGVPEFGEIVFLHRPSRTLIVADLVVNFPGHHGLWTNLLLHFAAAGHHYDPGMTVPFRNAVEDPAAFTASVNRMLEWDFDRVIVGHGEPIWVDGKAKLRAAIKAAGFADIA